MASFKALNIESDDEPDDEPDNTKEIQIEETLKLYQTALKLQSQGTSSWKECDEAFEELFKSEVFKYPEALSEYDRVQLSLAQDNGSQFSNYQDAGIYTDSVAVDNAPSTLPQVLHLSYKNRGQHHLDVLQTQISPREPTSSQDVKDARLKVSNVLNDLAEALDKDLDDVDLWRRAGRVGEILTSPRISRFCHESILEGDEQGTDEVLGDLGVEMKSSAHDFQEIAESIDDKLAINLYRSLAKGVSPSLLKQLSLYPAFPVLQSVPEDKDHARVEICCDRTWDAIGQALMQRLHEEQSLEKRSVPGTTYYFSIPDASSTQGRIQEVEFVSRPKSGHGHSESPTVVTNGTEPAPPLQNGDNAVTGDVETRGTTQSTRKRSCDVADLPEEAEGGRVRSKRIRARESIAAEANHSELQSASVVSGFDEKVKLSSQADQWLVEMLGPKLQRMGVDLFASCQPYRELVRAQPTSTSSDPSNLPLGRAVKDFYDAMRSWNDAKSKTFMDSVISKKPSADAKETGLNAFLEHSNITTNPQPSEAQYQEGVDEFFGHMNRAEESITKAACMWTFCLLYDWKKKGLCCSSYMSVIWPSDLKSTLSQIIVLLDDFLLPDLTRRFQICDKARLKNRAADMNVPDYALLEISQTLFELHLDIYTRMTSPDSEVPEESRCIQRGRLNEWASLARNIITVNANICELHCNSSTWKTFVLRHIWATVMHLKALGDVSREYLFQCITGLKKECISLDGIEVKLPNNTTMPELSESAAENAISRLETMDFFLGIFQHDGKPPVDLIESLEPLLESDDEPAEDTDTEQVLEQDNQQRRGSERTSTMTILLQFVKNARTPLRLSLWQRLKDAYQTIDYPPKLVSIDLRCIQEIMVDISSQNYIDSSHQDRETALLGHLRELKVLLASAVKTVSGNTNAFECVDTAHLQESTRAVADLWTVLYSVSLFDDYSQVGGKGGSSVNPFRFYPITSFHGASIALHDMQVQSTILLYKLFCEGMVQMPDSFQYPDEEKLGFLRYVHYQFGVRRICKAADSQFLHFMKAELMTLSDANQDISSDLAQVLYDLYDLNCFPSPLDRQDHGCDADYLDRPTAFELVDFVMAKANSVSMAVLLKSDIVKTVDKIHNTLGMIKQQNYVSARNRKIYTAYLKSPINPLDLFRSLQGVGDTLAIPVNPDEAVIASKGWYFLKGQISLAKYKAQKAKNAAGGTDEDLHEAVGFFLCDLEYNPENWETWLKLAQTHDALLDESVLWSAEKVNHHQNDLGYMHRQAIHTYLLATAVAIRTFDGSEKPLTKLSELYYDFAVCIYSATRPPFSMKAFSLEEEPMKHFSPTALISVPYTARPFNELTKGQAWKFAVACLRRAASFNPSNWLIHYMLGKIFWKIHTRFGNEETLAAMQDSFRKSLETLPKRDGKNQEPILEPIYKAVSITIKLVDRYELDVEAGVAKIEEYLAMQKQTDMSKRPQYSNSEAWYSYVIELLKFLRSADKNRWHHGLVMKAAQLMCTRKGDSASAKEYLIEQHIYSTKTLVMTVWKRDLERAGRHWIYMTRYARFISQLLFDTNDLEGIQLLAKRVKKKPNDFFNHAALWESICNTHVLMHRRHGQVPENWSEVIFKNLDQEEFASRAAIIDAWVADPATSHKLLEILRETAELKKQNAGLIKPQMIDDLLADTYAQIWKHINPMFPQQTATREQTPSIPQISEPKKSSPRDESRNVMSLNNLMNIDSTNERRSTPTPTPTPQPEAIPKPRGRMISKREIVKRAADAINNRPVVKAGSPAPKTPMQPLPMTFPKEEDSNTEAGKDETEKEEEKEKENDGESPKGSLHEDADDESELTDIEIVEEEEEEPDDIETIQVKPMSPDGHQETPDPFSLGEREREQEEGLDVEEADAAQATEADEANEANVAEDHEMDVD